MQIQLWGFQMRLTKYKTYGTSSINKNTALSLFN